MTAAKEEVALRAASLLTPLIGSTGLDLSGSKCSCIKQHPPAVSIHNRAPKERGSPTLSNLRVTRRFRTAHSLGLLVALFLTSM
jgi:hypothetical protein